MSDISEPQDLEKAHVSTLGLPWPNFFRNMLFQRLSKLGGVGYVFSRNYSLMSFFFFLQNIKKFLLFLLSVLEDIIFSPCHLLSCYFPWLIVSKSPSGSSALYCCR